MIHLILQMHPIMDNISRYDKSNTWDKHIKRGLPCSNGHSTTGYQAGKPADQQFDKRNKNSC